MIARVVERTLQDGGVTFDLATDSFADPENYWYFPKYPSRTRIVDPADLAAELQGFLEQNNDVCAEPDVWLGTWINPTSGQCYLDITTRRAGETEALDAARSTGPRKVVTIYNPFLRRTAYVWADVTS